MREYIKFETLKGLTLKSVNREGDEKLVFETSCGRRFQQVHHNDCCESVSIEDICGDLCDLTGSPILLAEEVESKIPDADELIKRAKKKTEQEYYYEPESETWTFYKLATIKGSVTIRWYGTSNGYYSESVSFEEIK